MTEPVARPPARDAAALAATVEQVMSLPLHQYLGLQAGAAENGRATAWFEVTPSVQNIVGLLHGGALYGLLDVVAFLALMSTQPDGVSAVTHDLHISLLRPGVAGQRVTIEAEVLRAGRQLAFMESRASVDGRLLAVARVTKSLFLPGAA